MLNKIIQFSLHNRLLVLVGAVLLMLAGLYSTHRTEVDVFPDLNAPTVVVMTEASGMAAEEVEQLVTFPLETAMNGATHVRRVRSQSSAGFSVVWVEFDWDTDIYLARQIVTEKLSTVADRLPANVGNPMLGPQSSILGEVLIIGLTADSTSLLDLRTLADWTIRPRLLSTGGVAQVSVIGGDVKEFQVLLRPDKMKHYGVSLDEILQTTRDMNLNSSGGVVYEYGNEYIVRGVVGTDDVERMAQVVVKQSADGRPIRLTDVAEVGIGSSQPKLGLASERGKAAVLLTVTKQPGVGTIELTEKLEAALHDVKKQLPADVKVSTDIFRQSHFIDSAIDNVKTSLLEGALFVVLVLFLFLANARTTFISLVTIPLSLIVALLVLHLFGLSINTMSLGGMAIAIGSLVDDAIVDVENVWKHLRENRALPEAERKGILEIVYEASREVRMPILNSTLIIVVSFVPLFFLSGMEGKMLVPLGVAFIVSLFASTLVALTLTPALCSYLLRTGKKRKGDKKVSEGTEPILVRKLKQLYEQSLKAVLRHKRVTLGSVAALFVLSFVAFLTLGQSFLPPFNEGSLTINVSTLPGISLEESDRMGRRAEEILLSIPEVKTVARKTGRAELDEHALGVNTSEIEAPFELKERTHQEFLDEVRHRLSEIQGANIEIGQPISHRIDAMLSGTQSNIAIKVFGDDLNELYRIGKQIEKSIADVEGIADLNVEQQIERPEIKIRPKMNMLANYGITTAELNEWINVCLAGEVVSQVYEGGKSFDLVVRAHEDERNSIESIRQLTICPREGVVVPLSDLADVISSTGPNTIQRENVKRKVVVSANTSGRDLGSVVADIQERVDAAITFPEGYHVEYGGQFESQQAAGRLLLVASLLSVTVIFLLLYLQFRSARQSAVVLVNLPLALIGGVIVLFFTTGEVSIPAIIGFISLFGIATRNGMLLIDHYNLLATQSQLSATDIVVKGSIDRLNPILMTALTSMLALLPLVINGSLPGNEIQSPMAKVILGGLFSSTLLNLYVVPTIIHAAPQLFIHHKKQ